MNTLWEQVQDNSKRLNSCSRHLFLAKEVKLGQILICENCKGKVSLTSIGYYIKGFIAAGGKAKDVWDAWK